MKCPLDNASLAITERQGVEIDYCPECRGVWLDRGELDKIIDKSDVQSGQNHQTEHRPKQEYQHDDRNQHYPKKKKRDSFLGELFDF